MKKVFNYFMMLSLVTVCFSSVVNAEPKQSTPIVWEDGGEPMKKGEQQVSDGVSSGESTNGGVFGGIDCEKPVIKGAKNRSVYLGSKLDFKKGIKVIDGDDGNITKKLKINSKNVNFKKAGKYKVIYSAIDKAGNKATKTVTVTIKERTN